jgi:hypothetical protein
LFHALLGCGLHPSEPRHHARFSVDAADGQLRVRGDSLDHRMHLHFRAHVTSRAQRRSVFRSEEQVRQIIHQDLPQLEFPPGKPPTGRPSFHWRSRIIPLAVHELKSSIFEDSWIFPRGVSEFDSAYWLRQEELVWNDAGLVTCDVAPA